MNKYRITKKFDSLCGDKEYYFYWVERKVLFMFWVKEYVFTSLEEAKLYIKAKKMPPIYE